MHCSSVIPGNAVVRLILQPGRNQSAELQIDGQSAGALGLDGSETYSVDAIDFSAGLPNPEVVDVVAQKPSGERILFQAKVRIDTPTEGAYYRHGGILQYVLRNIAAE